VIERTKFEALLLSSAVSLRGFAVFLFLFVFLWALPAEAGEWSGRVALEERWFVEEPLLYEQLDNQFSLMIQPEYHHSWDGDRQSLTVVPFARIDSVDRERSHFDLREFTWLKVGDGYEWRIGIRKLFWGVTESQHLVDIINQTDLVESPDGKEKLGQLMINLALIRGSGTIDLFVLPGFRERTFPGKKGRLRPSLPIDTNRVAYEASQEHVDLAARWSRSTEILDIGLSHFWGTSRDPLLLQGIDGEGQPLLFPRYDLIHQTGLDLQVIHASWLWKMEAIRRSGQGSAYTAFTYGFEYTLSNFLNTGIDIGLISEHLYDDRGRKATTSFQDDLMLGSRLALNDIQGTEVIFGVIFDRHSTARLLNLEASQRFGDKWRLTLEGRAFTAIPEEDTLFGLRQDDYIVVEWAWYF